MKKTKYGKNIVPAGAGKSTLGFLIDFTLTAAMMVILYYAVGIQIQRGLGLEDKQNQVNQMYENSYIIGKNSNGTYVMHFYTTGSSVEDYGYIKYGNDVWNYYTVFCTGDLGSFKPSDNFVGDRTNKVDVGKWVYKYIYNLNEDRPSSKLWKIPTDGEGHLDYTKNVQPSDEALNALAGNDDEWPRDSAAKDLRAFYCDAAVQDDVTSSSAGKMLDAITHFTNQERYLALNQAMTNIRYYSLLPSFAVAPLIFFLIIPMCIPNGRTIGKLAAGTAVVGVDGYKARKVNILIHYLYLTLIFEVMLIPMTVVAVMIFFLLMLVDYMALILSKTNSQSIHDRLARTVVVNAKQSIWFVDPEAEADYVRSHPNSNIAKIKNDELGDAPKKTADGRVLYSSTSYMYEDSVLDASTIGSARREAENLTSFDEYEAAKSAEMDEHRRYHEELKGKVTISSKEDLEKLGKEEPKEEPKEEVKEEPKQPLDIVFKNDETPNLHDEEDDGFVDSSTTEDNKNND